jgi:PAS domain S-box-containing protein
MTPFEFVSLVASIICLCLGLTVYAFNRKALLNKLFLLTSFFGFFYAFTEVLMWQSRNAAMAFFWSKMGSIWPFFAVFAVHFALVFAKSSWLKHKLTYLFLYGSAVLFWFIDLSTPWINTPPTLTYFGYNDLPSGTLIYWVSTAWVASLSFLAFVLTLRYYRTAVDETQKKQIKSVVIGFAVPIFTYLITNMLLPAAGIKTPNLGHFAVLFFSLSVTFGILRYNLFTFDAAIVAENIVSTIPDSLIIADLSGKMLRVNKRLINFLGYTENELVGAKLSKLCTNDALCMGVLSDIVENRAISNRELIYRTKQGEEKTVLFSGSVIESKTKCDVGFICVIRDITSRKKMEERLAKAEQLALIGELAGQIGHDLRNPLTGIKSAVYLLRKKGDELTHEQRNDVLDIIDNAVADSNRIVNSLADYSSALHLKMSKCTPKSLLKRALLSVPVPSRITILDNTQNEPELYLDVSKIEQVFVSLLKNAIDATPENGAVKISSVVKGETLELVFSDDGLGIPADILPRLFSPLVTTKAKGMGMSLAICKRVIEAHGGTIAVESTLGQGTTLTITLPITSPPTLAVKPELFTPSLSK